MTPLVSYSPLSSAARTAALLLGIISIANSLHAQSPATAPAAPPPATPALPAVVKPGADTAPPSDAIVLFDGTDASHWTQPDGQPIRWTVADGILTVVPKTTYIVSKETFADAQIHLEFREPLPVTGTGQGRGNSGVYLHGRYEIQVLDSYDNPTYPNGQCAAVYGQHIPLVNACRPPGEWQTYDIVFHGPRLDSAGKVIQLPNVTVIQNGILVEDHVEIKSPTQAAIYKQMPASGPLVLQEHHNPVSFRNIWIRPLPVAGDTHL
jgi:hypothetical protein